MSKHLTILFILFLLTSCSTSTGENQAPTAAFSLNPSSGSAPLIVSFDASGSRDRDGSISTYLWDFGDNRKDEGIEVKHTFSEAGNFEISLSVTDSEGAVNSTKRIVTVQTGDPAPDVDEPGEYGCEDCPDTSESTEDTLLLGNQLTLTGEVTDAEGNGSFYVRSSEGETAAGSIPTQTSGDFSVTLTLFCGEQLLKRAWANEEGRYVIVNRITVEQCS